MSDIIKLDAPELHAYAECLLANYLDTLVDEIVTEVYIPHFSTVRFFDETPLLDVSKSVENSLSGFLKFICNIAAEKHPPSFNNLDRAYLTKSNLDLGDLILSMALPKSVLIRNIDKYTTEIARVKKVFLQIEYTFHAIHISSRDLKNNDLIKEGISFEMLNMWIPEKLPLLFFDQDYAIVFSTLQEEFTPETLSSFLENMPISDVFAGKRIYISRSSGQPSYILLPVFSLNHKVIGSIIINPNNPYKNSVDLEDPSDLLQHVALASPDLIYVLDIQTGKNIYSNKDFAEVLGYSRQDRPEQGFDLLRKIIFPDDIHYLDDRLETFRKVKDGDILEAEIRFVRKNGEFIWLSIKSRIFKRDQSGKPLEIMGICSDITKRKRVEEELSNSKRNLEEREMQLLEAQEIANLGSFEWNVLNDTATTTPVLRKILGLGNQEFVGFKEFAKNIHPEDQERVLQAIEQAFRTGSPYNSEYRIYRRDDGQLRYLLAKGKVDLTADGKPKRMVGTLWDITERKEVEQRLQVREKELKELNASLEKKVEDRTVQLAYSAERIKANEQQLRLITDALPALVSYVDLDQKFSFLNERYHTWFGVSIQNIIGKNVLELLGEEAYQKVAPYISRTLVDGLESNYEAEMPYKYGGVKYVQGKFIPDLDSSGKVKGMITLIVDISERKQGEETLKSAFKHASIGMTITDMEGRYVYINPAYTQITGYSEDELHQLTTRSITHPDDLPLKDRMMQQMISQEIPGFVIEKRYIRKDGEIIWVQNSLSLMRDPEGNPYNIISLTQDITKEKKAQEQLHQSSEMMKKINVELSEKNEQLVRINNDLDNFVYTASHDIKAPVSNIEGLMSTLSDTLLQNGIENEEISMILKLINNSIDRFKNTITDLTEISKIQKDLEKEITSINLCEIIEDVKFSIQDQIRKTDAEIHSETDACPILKFSRKDITSIVYNLLSNAIKYKSPLRRPVIHIKTYLEPNYVVLSVTDNGLGINETNKLKAFQMFKRFHDHVEGSGIGLYIVKRIVENNGGKIELDSEVNVGTTFRIYLRT